MKVYLSLLIVFISFNLFSYETQYSGHGLCGEKADFKIDSSFFDNYLDYYDDYTFWNHDIDGWYIVHNDFSLEANDVKHAAQLAANWWNEAGSEHELDFKNSSNAMPIKLAYIAGANSTAPSMVTWPAWEAWGTICIDPSESEIIVNEKLWHSVNEKGLIFINDLTHELGHLLGLDHYNDTVNIMRSSSSGYYTHINSDDKYGVASLYGRDENVMRTTTATWNSSSYGLNFNDTYWYMNGDSYDTFVKPAIVYQPDPYNHYDWDYIVTWVDSDSKKVKYAFTKDGGTNSNDMITVHGPYYISHSYHDKTLSAPSIAVSTDGSEAIIVYKDRNSIIKYSIINTSTLSSGSIRTITSYNDDNNHNNGTHIAKTKGIPVVAWNGDYEWGYGKFLLFWPESKWGYSSGFNVSSHQNWTIKYNVVGDWYSHPLKVKSNISPYNESRIFSFWNQMAVSCDFGIMEFNKCILYFNELDTLSTDIDYQRLSRVFISIKNNYSKLIVDKTENQYYHYRYPHTKNYGHLSLIKTPYNYLEFLLTYIDGSLLQPKVKTYGINITQNTNNSYDTNTGTISNNDSYNNKWSRTGHSGVYNPHTGKYRFIWIKQ